MSADDHGPTLATRPPTSGHTSASVKWTERMILDRLAGRYNARAGNGPEWAYMEHVRDAAGFFATRTIDALAVHLWPSRHHETHAFEVKVSRSDFRRELADPSKAEAWSEWVEYFWIVAPRGVVPPEELPVGWGLMVTHGDYLAVAKQAKRLRPKPQGSLPAGDLPRTVVAAMLRAMARTAERATEATP